jgi:catechol 2,3-dioxygenase-like lactoylglutathione lyase family enzyme
MAVDLTAVRIDANDPRALARFWAAVLAWDVVDSGDKGVLLRGDAAYGLRLVPSAAPKAGRTRMHFDLTSTSAEDQARIVERALRIGGSHYDVGQRGDEGHVVLADPEGNEFCVIEPENRFLAGCGAIGALNCEGTRATGGFWTAALGWPLVWDQDEETAVQSPLGGSKATWSGPPLFPKPPTGRNRLRFELAVDREASLDDEVARLLGFGAALADGPADRPDELTMTDPDDNEFHLVAAR